MQTHSITGYGVDYERPIGALAAVRILAPFPIPRMGYETDVASNRDEYGFVRRLVVQNISGRFVLASAQAKRDEWANVFNFKG